MSHYTGIFRKSSFCIDGSCVEVAPISGEGMALRDSKDVSRAALVFTAEEWNAYIQGVKSGEFDFQLPQ